MSRYKIVMAKGDELEERLIDFAARILAFCDELPKALPGRHVAGQLLRSGTSPAPNYGEARGAESRKDFVHKLSIALKELNETSVWLRILERSEMIPAHRVETLLTECIELSKILNASIRTARTNGKRQARPSEKTGRLPGYDSP